MQEKFRQDLAVQLLAIGLLGSGCRLRSTEQLGEGGAPSAKAAPAAVSARFAESSLPRQAPASQPAPSAAAEVTAATAVVAIAGLGTNPTNPSSTLSAVQASHLALEAGAPCLDAAVAGVVVLEDDPNLNAGTGAALRLDDSAELDAAVMDSEGRFGAVAGISAVKNPSKVARAVADTPHLLLGGKGATRFAERLGFESFEPRTEAAFARQRALLSGGAGNNAPEPGPEVVRWAHSGAGGGTQQGWRAYLEGSRAGARAPATASTPKPSSVKPGDGGSDGAGGAPEKSAAPHPGHGASSPAASAIPSVGTPIRAQDASVGPSGADTVGVLIRCGPGHFAGAVSGGGPWLSLPGRIGDVPVPGGALYVGPKGAVFVSGPGESILRRLLARTIYDKLSTPASLEATLSWALAEFPRGELAVAVVDASRVIVAPESATAWAAVDPALRTSAGAR